MQCDVAIVGGGLVGASMALALARSGRDIVLIEGVAPESSAQPSFDERTTALGNGSRRILEALGVWPQVAGVAQGIRTIHVSDAGRFGFARLNAREQGIDAFGFVVANRALGTALWGALRESPVRLLVPARPRAMQMRNDAILLSLEGAGVAAEAAELHARLVIGADGAHSALRQWAGIDARMEDYGQVALVVNVAADRAHDGTAYERFTAAGPLAVLPVHGGGYTVVWAMAPQEASRVAALEQPAFLAELQQRFGWRVGRFARAGRAALYPLELTRALKTIAPRSVFIGNAAQSLHPVAGQGFNLGLRDAAMLAELLAGSEQDPGSMPILERFAAWRDTDRRAVIRFTDGLVRLFGSRVPGMGLARDLGLLLFDVTPAAKSALARLSIGFSGPTPRLARGLALR